MEIQMLRIRRVGRKRKKRNGMKDDMSKTMIKSRMEIKEGYGSEKIGIILSLMGGL